MRLIRTNRHRGKFEPLYATRKAQVAMMTLAPGGTSDDQLGNEHPRCEQWLYVISGRGRAMIARKKQSRRSVRLTPGLILVIERGELHQIENSGTTPLRTLNLYVPPAYRTDGNLRSTAK